MFFLHVVFALIAGTAIPLAYDSLPEGSREHAPFIMWCAFLVVGVLVGYFTRKATLGRLGGFNVVLAVGILQAVYLAWLCSQLVSLNEAFSGTVAKYTPYSWAGAQILGAMVLGLTRARSKRTQEVEYKPTDEEVKAFITENKLFVSDQELEAMAARPKGLVCSICRVPYTGEEDRGELLWKERWVRCPRAPEHVFHARDFERTEWRCPVDKTLLYRRKL